MKINYCKIFVTLLCVFLKNIATGQSFPVTVLRDQGHFLYTINEPGDYFQIYSLQEKGIKEDGVHFFVKDIKLSLDWWNLLGEFVEDYRFLWTTSGHYMLDLTENINGSNSISVKREDLVKYPDLLARFDNLKPDAIYPIIRWKFCHPSNTNGISAEQYAILTHIGTEDLISDFRRYVGDGPFLHEPSGVEPIHMPGSPNWKEFFNQYPLARPLFTLNDYYKIKENNSLYQTSEADIVKLTKAFCNTPCIQLTDFELYIDWPVEEMKNIYIDYYNYKFGKIPKSPKQVIDSAATKASTYSNSDNNAEPYMVPFTTYFGKSYNNYTTTKAEEKITGTVNGEGKLYGKGIVTVGGKDYEFPINTTTGEFSLSYTNLALGANYAEIKIGDHKFAINITREEAPIVVIFKKEYNNLTTTDENFYIHGNVEGDGKFLGNAILTIHEQNYDVPITPSNGAFIAGSHLNMGMNTILLKFGNKTYTFYITRIEKPPIIIRITNVTNNYVTTNGVLEIRGKIITDRTDVKLGEVLNAGYKQSFSINSSKEFVTKVILSSGTNTITFKVDNGQEKISVYLDRAPVDLRVTLTWNSSGSDIDLYVTNPSNYTCSYQNKIVGDMTLDVDNTQGYGPENIYVRSANTGTYNVKVQNYSNGVNTKATVYVFVNEQLKEVKDVVFNSAKETLYIGSYKF